MAWVLVILYIAVGTAATFFYKYECIMTYNSRFHDHSDDTAVAIISGVFWPVVAPLAFAILFAKKYAGENDKR